VDSQADPQSAHRFLFRNDGPRVIRVEEAGELFGLKRAAAYRAAHRWLDTNGREGLPVLRLNGHKLVVPVAALNHLLTTAQMPSINDAS
jgi:hypothetical protein